MASRSETGLRKAALLQSVRDLQRAVSGGTAPPAPSQRELAIQFGLSTFTVSQLMLQLEREGLLYTVPRVGTFLGRPSDMSSAPYLMLRPSPPDGSFLNAMQAGFEARLGELGGTTLALTPREAEGYLQRGQLPDPAGLFETAGLATQDLELPATLPRVRFGGDPARGMPMSSWDVVDFDNTEGGQRATHHLLRLGHRKIAFLALHDGSAVSGPMAFSLQRENGWRKAMVEAGQSTRGLAFHPPAVAQYPHDVQEEISALAAATLLRKNGVTAVLAANSFAAKGLMMALGTAGIPASHYPAVVCFDSPPSGGNVISSMQLPWDLLGREAAQILWDRTAGRLSRRPIIRHVKMSFIARLTSHSDWALSPLAHERALSDVTLSDVTLSEVTLSEVARPHIEM